MVELSVHAMFVPVCASVSKFSVSGTPRVVILPPLVSADEGGIRDVIPIPSKTVAINANRMRYDRIGAEGDLDMEYSSQSVNEASR
jgi:hypothetical protein